jgi:LPXTG-site transpeptidase (sortase) family protein
MRQLRKSHHPQKHKNRLRRNQKPKKFKFLPKIIHKFSSRIYRRVSKIISRIPLKVGVTIALLGITLIILPIVFPIFIKKNVGKTPFIKNVATNSAQLVNIKNPFKIDPKLLGTNIPYEAPLRIVIPSLSVDLPIVEAKVIDGYWETSETTASHGIGSSYPGEEGNVVIFAHARENLFGPLRNIKHDDNIYVLTKDSWHRYRVSEIKLVNPNEIENIAPTLSEKLTLYTCSGFLDSKRIIVGALPDAP